MALIMGCKCVSVCATEGKIQTTGDRVLQVLLILILIVFYVSYKYYG